NGKGWITTQAAAGWLRGIELSQAAHIVERLTRVSEDTIQYEATIEDPNVYTSSWKVAFPLNKDERYRIFEYACHEGNRALENMLRLAQSDGSSRKTEQSGGVASENADAFFIVQGGRLQHVIDRRGIPAVRMVGSQEHVVCARF